jgi:geranylgeranyl reductase family protein
MAQSEFYTKRSGRVTRETRGHGALSNSAFGSEQALDVVVVGSGPAGSTCALQLARSGLSVAILDKSPPPRYKTCGGGVVGRARKLVGFDIAPVVEHECRSAEMRLLDERVCFRVEREEPLVSMTMRTELDGRLLDEALGAGARIIAPCELRGLGAGRSDLSIATSRGPLRARYVVAADGTSSRTARAAGWPENHNSIPAVESELHVDPAAFERLRSTARFDLGLPRHGYAWVFPKRQHLSFGCLTTRRGSRGLRQCLERYLEVLGVDRVEARSDHGSLIPVAPRARVLARDRVLLTGDAAGLADPVICEGITHAIASGRHAGEAIATAPGSPSAVYAAYHRALSRNILSELRIARVLARVLYDRLNLRVALFRRVGRPFCEAFTEIICGRQSYRSLFLRPSNYFRLLAAYARRS